jgi:hypothetical protein
VSSRKEEKNAVQKLAFQGNRGECIHRIRLADKLHEEIKDVVSEQRVQRPNLVQ